jgi:predicted ester cyclase
VTLIALNGGLILRSWPFSFSRWHDARSSRSNYLQKEPIVTESPDAVIHTWFEEVWNRQDESAIDRLMSSQAVAHGLTPEPLRGPAGFKPLFHTFRKALGNIRIDVVRTVTEGDTCVAHCHVTGRHVGAEFGAPATNNPVDFWGTTIARVKNGQIVEGWNTFDFLTMYQQIGWVRTPVLPA